MREHGIRAYFNFALIHDTLRTSMSKRRRYRNKYNVCLILHFTQNPNIGYDVIVQERPSSIPYKIILVCWLLLLSTVQRPVITMVFLNKEVRRWVKEMIFFSLAFWHQLGWVSMVRVCGLNMFSVENAWLPPCGRILFGSF